VDNTYTYEPFGEMLTPECTENVSNPFKFTGQYFDSEIEEYYLRARQYNPYLALFSSRDPVLGKLREPASLHPYLYCLNDPVNRTNPDGEFSIPRVLCGVVIGAALGAIQPALQWDTGTEPYLLGAFDLTAKAPHQATYWQEGRSP